ncbi:helix-turn-helix transcriptional regulator [Veronia nyctiphanis]|nr:AraC family transcriptional regulator [Veronia nyctiphanis]
MGKIQSFRTHVVHLTSDSQPAKTEEQFLERGCGSLQQIPMKGRVFSYENSDAFSLHGGKTYNEANTFLASSAPAGLVLTFLLSGKVNVNYDGLAFDLDASEQPKCLLVNLSKTVPFYRRLQAGEESEKLNVVFLPQWVIERSRPDCMTSLFMEKHLTHALINPSQQLCDIAKDILWMREPNTFSERIFVDRLVYQLMGEVFDSLSVADFTQIESGHEYVIKSNNERLDDGLTGYIEAHLDDDLSLERLASTFHTSVSNLQRKAREQLGEPLNRYVRRRRLEIAKFRLTERLMTVSQAAYSAGYQHPSNFTNAFKREFGFSPSQLTETQLLSAKEDK